MRYEAFEVIGTDDLVPVASLPPDWLPILSAVVRISTPTETGTGFFVRPDLVMTNNHVIPDQQTLAGSTIKRQYWGPEPPIDVGIDAIAPIRTSERLDCTLLAVTPSESVQPLPLADRDPRQGDEVIIVGHPRGLEMRYTAADLEVTEIVSPFIEYRADSDIGSSGSPVLNKQTGMVVALHHRDDYDGDKSNEGVLISAIQREFDV